MIQSLVSGRSKAGSEISQQTCLCGINLAMIKLKRPSCVAMEVKGNTYGTTASTFCLSGTMGMSVTV